MPNTNFPYNNYNTPTIIDIQKTTMNTLKQRLGWKIWLIIGCLSAWSIIVIVGYMALIKHLIDARIILVLILPPWLCLFLYYIKISQLVRSQFWQEFALTHNWLYETKGNPEEEAGIMFHQSTNQQMHHVITGHTESRPMRIFEFEFTKGSGENKTTYYYTVFEFKFNGQFPHLYLNQLKNHYGIKIGEKISLPVEFEKYFTLSAPKKYEIEALQIFTPNVLEHLLKANLEHDIEIVDQELLIFKQGCIERLEQLENEFVRAVDIAKLFAFVLDKIKLTQIGDYSYKFTN